MTRSHTYAWSEMMQRILRTKAVLTPVELLALGMTEAEIRRYRRRGWLARVARGVYASQSFPPTPARPIVVAAVRIPTAVVTGPAALFLHGPLDEPPAEVWLAICANARPPRVGPPVRFIWSAVKDPEVLVVEGVSVRVATPERALADCVLRHVSAEVVEAVAARMVVPTTSAPEGVAA